MGRLRTVVAAAAVATLCILGHPAHAYVGAGFTLQGEHALLPEYDIYLVDSTPFDVEVLRSEVQRAADDYEAITGLTATVAAGTIADRAAGHGEILVRVTPDMGGCGEVNTQNLLSPGITLGCADSGRGYDGPRPGVYYQTSTYIRISPLLLTVYSSRLPHSVMHEMGHAFGLSHFNAVFEGQVQVMHGSNAANDTFQSGDRNGLLFQRDYGL
ncbi:MAG TPA: hypothetical protein VNA20_06320 [Frankiaceae bacterium]|nr:hypothetical protein [Frankiaceae bacterium]